MSIIMYKKLFFSFAISVAFLLTACGGGDDKPIPVAKPEIISFTASTTEITEGESVKLTAIFSNGQGSIDVGVGSINSGDSRTVKPNTPTTYTLTVENSAGVKLTSAITINIVRLKIIGVTSPVDGASVHDDAYISVDVVAMDGLNQVTIETEGRSGKLTSQGGSMNSNAQRISGYFSFTGLADGDYILDITARDYLARTVTIQKQVTVDNLPEIIISEPSNYAFANPYLPLDIACSDEATGSCLISVKNQDTTVASATNQLNQTIDLSDFIGEEVILTIEGDNNAGQIATKNITVYVNNGDVTLNHIKTFSDEIIDFDGERALLYNDVPSENKQLQIANTSNDDITVIAFNNAHKIYADKSLLTPTGAIFSASTGSTYDWNHDELLNLGAISKVRGTGDFVLFQTATELFRRQLSTQANTQINVSISDAEISDDGSIVGENDWSLLLLKEGVTTRINLQPESSGTSEGPLIDNSLILYHETGANLNARRIILHDGNNMLFAITPSFYWGATNIFSLDKGRDYSINNGWISYIDGSDSVANQLWTRDPQGNLLQRTHFQPVHDIYGRHVGIVHLADNGELMLSYNGQRYLSKPNGDIFLVGSVDLGTIYYQNNTWFMVIKESLFKLVL